MRSLILRGVHGHVVRFIDFDSLATHHGWFESPKGFYILLCEEVIQLHVAYRMSVVLLSCLLILEILHEVEPRRFISCALRNTH